MGSRGRPESLKLAALAPVVAMVALTFALLITHATAPPELGDPGPVVRWGLPILEVLVALAAFLTIGALGFAVMIVPRTPPPRDAQRDLPHPASGDEDPAWSRLMRVASLAAALWLGLGVVRLIFSYASLAGMPLTSIDLVAGGWQFATQISLGRALALSCLVVFAALVGCTLTTRYVGALWSFVLALAALVPWAATGHAAGAGDHMLAMSASWLHWASIALWAGGLAAIALVWPWAHQAWVERYSRIAGWCLLIAGLSGLGAAIVRLDSPSQLVTTPYGQVLGIKIVVFAALAALGLAQRRRVIGALSDPDPRTPAAPRPAAAVTASHPASAPHSPSPSAASSPTSPSSPTGPTSAAGTSSAPDSLSTTGTTASAGRWGLLARLASIEIALMAIAAGLAVGLANSAPPVANLASPSLVEQLTGAPLPPAPRGSAWLTVWRPDLLLGFVCVAGIVVYAQWAVRLHRRGDHWPGLRTAAWMGGMVVMLWSLNGSPAAYGHLLFSQHMLLHMSVAMLAPVLLVLGAPVTLLLRAVPGRRDGSRGPREWMLAVVHSRWGRFFAHPVVAAVNFVGSMILFYYTPLFDLALATHLGHIVMVVHFTLVGYLFTNALIGIDPGPDRPGYPLRMLLLFSTMVFHAFFGLALISSVTVLGAPWFDRLGELWGMDRLADQVRGGAITWGVGEIPTLVVAVILAVQWTRADERTARRLDRAAARDGDAELEAYNARLARLAEQDSGTSSP